MNDNVADRSVTDGVPQLMPKLLAYLETHVHHTSRVWEWGSGGSTLWLARRYASVVSVEHGGPWHAKVHAATKSQKNCEVLLREPVPGNTLYRSDPCPGLDFRSYVCEIDRVPNGSLGLVVVDGRARVACVKRAVLKVALGGYLVLDDSQRKRYDEARLLLKGWQQTCLVGRAPQASSDVESTVWRRA